MGHSSKASFDVDVDVPGTHGASFPARIICLSFFKSISGAFLYNPLGLVNLSSALAAPCSRELNALPCEEFANGGERLPVSGYRLGE